MMYLLFGENAYAKQQALQELIEKAKTFGEQAVERFEGESLELSRLSEILQGVSLFSAEKMVIIRHASQQKVLWNELEPWTRALPEGTTLVLLEAAPDRRTKTFKSLQKHAAVREFQTLPEPEATKWLLSEAKARGGNLTQAEARHLVARAGTDQWRLSNELNKLLAHGGVSLATIDALVEQTPQANVFALLDATLHKDPRAVAELLQAAKTSEDPYMLAGLLSAQLLQLAALVHGRDLSVDEIAKQLGAHSFPLRKLSPLARQLPASELQTIVETAATLDTQLKSTGLDPWLLLEQTLMKIATR